MISRATRYLRLLAGGRHLTDLSSLNWIEAPEHPALKYAEDGDNLILKYYKTHVYTNWDKVERVVPYISTDENAKLRNNNAFKRGIRSITGEPHTQNKRCGARLFVRLVAYGKIRREGA